MIDKLETPKSQRYDSRHNPIREDVKNEVLVNKINEMIEVVNQCSQRIEGVMGINPVQNTDDSKIKDEMARMSNKIQELSNKIKAMGKE